MAEVVLLPDRVPSLGRVVDQFLAAKPLSANGRRRYAYPAPGDRERTSVW